MQILERGGNAIDAAIATNAVMGLVEPHYNGIGGDLFAIYYEAKTGKLYGLNAGGWAPTGLTPALLKAKGSTRMPGSGIYSVTVPGAVEGLGDAARALRHAADGGSARAGDLLRGRWISGHRRDRECAGTPPRASCRRIRAPPRPSCPTAARPRPARSSGIPISRTRCGSSPTNGPAGFYEGKTAEAILAISSAKGGTMTAADLKEYQPEWVEPISTTYRGWTVYELPPNTQGIAALMMLNIMEQFPLGEYGLTSTKALHVMIEAKKLAYADMLRYVADPKFAKVPVLPMLSKAARARRARR